jgi:hypothetical protein
MKWREVNAWGGVVRGGDRRGVVGHVEVNSPLHAYAPKTPMLLRLYLHAYCKQWHAIRLDVDYVFTSAPVKCRLWLGPSSPLSPPVALALLGLLVDLTYQWH